LGGLFGKTTPGAAILQRSCKTGTGSAVIRAPDIVDRGCRNDCAPVLLMDGAMKNMGARPAKISLHQKPALRRITTRGHVAAAATRSIWGGAAMLPCFGLEGMDAWPHDTADACHNEFPVSPCLVCCWKIDFVARDRPANATGCSSGIRDWQGKNRAAPSVQRTTRPRSGEAIMCTRSRHTTSWSCRGRQLRSWDAHRCPRCADETVISIPKRPIDA